MSHPSIAKFGGTSVADYDCMLACAKIVVNDPNIHVVVLSASAGATNLLIKLANGCEQAERTEYIQQIRDIQFNILDKIGEQKMLAEEIERILNNICRLSEAASLATSPALVDELVSYGEIMSSLIFNQILQKMNHNSVWFDIRKVIKTNSHFGKATPNEFLTKKNGDEFLQPLIQENKLIVTQGFIASDSLGKTTTLGRGGSDYSAALLAEALSAKEVLIWTDVPGIYTTDPRVVKQAKRIENISFAEATEMATFGAKVLHPATLLPAMRSNIPVYVGSSKSPQEGGTWVIQKTENRPAFRAIALRRDQTLLTLSSLNMLHAQGFLANVFNILAKYKISVDIITTSEISLALTLDKTGSASSGADILSSQLLAELNEVCNVKVDANLALVALIGNDLHMSAGIAKRIFNTLEKYNIRMISYGASTNNVCLLVPNEHADDIVRALHAELFE